MSATEVKPGGGNMIVRDVRLTTKLRDLWDTPASLASIADELHCGTSTVVRAVRELCLTPRPSPIHPGSNCAKKPYRKVPTPVGATVTQFRTVAPPPKPYVRVVVETPPRRCQWPISDGRPWKLCDEPCSGTYCSEHQHLSRFGRPK